MLIPHHRWSIVLFIVTLGGVITACHDWQAVSPTANSSPEDSPLTFRERTINLDSLWWAIAAGDSIAVVGIKHPGTMRGVVDGRVTVHPSHVTAVRSQLQHAGIEVIDLADILPVVVARLTQQQALSWIVQQNWVDYVEPAVFRNVVSLQSNESGCPIPAYNGGGHTTSWPGVTDMVPFTYNGMRIPQAWDLSSGSGVTVGLTDTGIFTSSTQLTTHMVSGHSAARQYEYLHTANYFSAYIDDTGCSHGPRMAGVIAAPRDGVGPIGVAWGADFVNVRHNESVTVFSTLYAASAINAAAARSQIVVIAWGAPDWSSQLISDDIAYWHYNYDRLFVAAAGTYLDGTPYDLRRKVVFPANMPEVVAATAADWPSGTLNGAAAHGSAVDLAAYINQVTVSTGSTVASISGTSNAAAVIGGVAALVWARYPHMTRDQIRERLYFAANGNPWATAGVKSGDLGYGIPNAYKAVGGFWHLNIDGPDCVDGRPGMVQLLANARGDGPFTYSWSTAATTNTIEVPSPARGDSVSAHVHVTDGLQGKVRTASHTITALAVDDPRRACD
jgi:serine protease